MSRLRNFCGGGLGRMSRLTRWGLAVAGTGLLAAGR
jgi:hypothetical protein